MLKKYEYCKKVPKIWRKGTYAQEHNLIHELLGGGNTGLCLSYGNKHEANNAAQSLRRFCNKVVKQPVKVLQRNHNVYIVKEEK